MHGNDRTRPLRDLILDLRGIDVVEMRFAVDKDRRRTDILHRLGRRKESIRGNNDLITAPDPKRKESDLECVRPVGNRDAVSRANISGKRGLKR